MNNYQRIYKTNYLFRPGYLLASILSALVGNALPFWLRPPGFTFKWLSAFEFLIATFLFHLTFLLLNIFFNEKNLTSHFRNRLLFLSVVLIIIFSLLGLHLTNEITLHKGVPPFVFIAFGLATFFAGLLYVAPPFSFNKRVGGEIIIAEGLGMLPVVGAYIVQVGDITRTVYIASLPIVVVTGLWIWIIEIINQNNDEKIGKKTLVIDFGVDFSSRFGVAIIIILFILSILFAVVSKSLSPLFLIILLLLGLVWNILVDSWKNYTSPDKMKDVGKKVILLHSVTCLLMIISSLLNYE